jgi:hypothetical protein
LSSLTAEPQALRNRATATVKRIRFIVHSLLNLFRLPITSA